MNMHKNARLTVHSRAELVRRVLREGQSAKTVATAFGAAAKTTAKWVKRLEAEGPDGLEDRSSRPHRLNRPTPPETVAQVTALRRQRFCGQQIAKDTGISPATVSRIPRVAAQLGLKHIKTRPYTPKTNGKAERFIQTALREWAYAQAYPSSDRRAAELPTWLHRYNWHRPHGGKRSRTPISRLGSDADNLLRLHS